MLKFYTIYRFKEENSSSFCWTSKQTLLINSSRLVWEDFILNLNSWFYYNELDEELHVLPFSALYLGKKEEWFIMVQVSDENRNQWKNKILVCLWENHRIFGGLLFLSRNWTMTFLKKKSMLFLIWGQNY